MVALLSTEESVMKQNQLLDVARIDLPRIVACWIFWINKVCETGLGTRQKEVEAVTRSWETSPPVVSANQSCADSSSASADIKSIESKIPTMPTK